MQQSAWPTILSFARLAAAPIVAGLVLWAHASVLTHGPARAALIYAIAGLLFLAAALTDALDGWLARRLNAVSPLGAALDHAADKALVAAALVALAYALLSPALVAAAVILVVRDIAVAGLREGLANSGRTLPVSQLGKAKAAAEMIGVGALLFSPAAASAAPALLNVLTWIAHAAIWGAVLLALWSAGAYLRTAFSSPARG